MLRMYLPKSGGQRKKILSRSEAFLSQLVVLLPVWSSAVNRLGVNYCKIVRESMATWEMARAELTKCAEAQAAWRTCTWHGGRSGQIVESRSGAVV
jgi:hypothetical protein